MCGGERPADDREIFERLMFEIFHAGLSWTLIWNKREGLRSGYAGFDIAKVAGFGPADVERLMNDPDVVRSARKIDATIANARTVLQLQVSHGSLEAWMLGVAPGRRCQAQGAETDLQVHGAGCGPVLRRIRRPGPATTPSILFQGRATTVVGNAVIETVTVSNDELHRFARLALESREVTPEQAAICADVMVEQDLRGHGHHGTANLRARVADVDDGVADPRAEMEVLAEMPAMIALDARRALGPVVSVRAMDACIAKAKTQGVGLATVRQMPHWVIPAYYSMRAGRARVDRVLRLLHEPLLRAGGRQDARAGKQSTELRHPGRSAAASRGGFRRLALIGPHTQLARPRSAPSGRLGDGRGRQADNRACRGHARGCIPPGRRAPRIWPGPDQ